MLFAITSYKAVTKSIPSELIKPVPIPDICKVATTDASKNVIALNFMSIARPMVATGYIVIIKE